jgi:hypothetical protein
VEWKVRGEFTDRAQEHLSNTLLEGSEADEGASGGCGRGAALVSAAGLVVALVGLRLVWAFAPLANGRPDRRDRFEQRREDDRVVTISPGQERREWDTLRYPTKWSFVRSTSWVLPRSVWAAPTCECLPSYWLSFGAEIPVANWSGSSKCTAPVLVPHSLPRHGA